MTEYIQKIKLQKGENWISINVKPYNNSIYNIFNYNNLNEGDTIRSKYKKVIFKNGKFKGNLKTIEGNTMYIIYLKKGFNLIIKGDKINKIKDIKLEKGENWFSYNSLKKTMIENIIQNPFDNDYIKYKNKKIIYKDNKWLNNNELKFFEPHKGYIIFLNSKQKFSLIENLIVPNKEALEDEVKEKFIDKKKSKIIYYIILGIIIMIIIYFIYKKFSMRKLQ